MTVTAVPFRPQLPFRPAPGDARETERLVEGRLLTRVLLDVVVASGPPADPPLRADALLLIVPERLRERGAVVVERAAAWYWTGEHPPGQVDVAVAPGTARTPTSRVVRHERRMPPGDAVAVPGRTGTTLQVSTPARTAADLLRLLPEPDGDLAARALAGATGTSAADVAVCLDALSGARGVVRARALLARWGDRPT